MAGAQIISAQDIGGCFGGINVIDAYRYAPVGQNIIIDGVEKG